MADTIRARHSLQDEAEQMLRRAFEGTPGPRSRVLWWDAGGYLRSIIQEASERTNATFVSVDTLDNAHPLQFRQWVARQGAHPDAEPERTVWYVPEGKQDRDWFRDVEAMGEVFDDSIEDLAARLYGIQKWRLRPWESDDEVSRSVAVILEDQLTVASRPNLQDLQARILTGDESQPVEYLLREEWGRLPRTSAVIDKIRDLLEGENVPNLDPGDDPDTIVNKVRRWAVAGWLHRAGVPTDHFPEPIASSRLGYAYRRLRPVLKADAGSSVLSEYQVSYWPEVVDNVEDPWTLLQCPVDGAVEERLWDAWLEAFDAGEHVACQKRARTRTRTLREATGRSGEEIGKASPPWIRAWHQAASLAELARRYETWAERDAPPHVLYADREDGSWHIDAAVRQIIVSGTPEDDLPNGHPALDALGRYRAQLVEDDYLQYLQELAGKMETALAQDRLLDEDLESSVQFWEEHKEELGAGNDAVLFYLDALRLDLARELADRLQERSDASSDVDLTINESTRLGVLPSETEFGMAAVLPHTSPRRFDVRMTDGALRASSSGQGLDTTRRHRFLREEGWTIAPHDASPWSNNRVAYVDTELDDIGENDLAQIEKKLAERVDELADLIFGKMRQGNWSRAYVVTDHGFVLLPEGTRFEALSPPDGEVKRRRVAADDLSADGHGVLLTRERIPDLHYLSSPVRILVDPQERFKKQGLTDARYYHGGALPQECILSFLTIEAA